MPLSILTVPCLADNYAFVAHDPESGDTAVVDVPETAPIVAAIEAQGWVPTHVLLTHHHADHVQGLDALLARFPAKVVGAKADVHRLPPLDIEVSEGDTLQLGNERIEVLSVPGHTSGHIAYYAPGSAAVFSADSLMALGCGRLFEGTAEQMWDSLQKFMALPEDTTVYSGHEYTAANGRFAMTVEPGNPALVARIAAVDKARADGIPTVPSKLSEELATNPFLRGHVPEVQQSAGLPGAAPVAVFAKVRKMKDDF